ncbi:MAG TPA: glycosyltransferase, partial [Nitrospira sp.]|nr:glycosyltransferase [Nitrospira sp.]
MQQTADSPEHHRQRSEFIRNLVQRRLDQCSINDQYGQQIPRTIVQYWHDLRQLPLDVGECVASWARWEAAGFTHRLYDEHTAKAFIGHSLGSRYECAFERCYHPAMQADYFRLCYLLVEGGFYVDADDICIGTDIAWLFEDGRLKLQPLCYDVASGAMVKPSQFLCADAHDPSWIFYFNNNPLIASRHHPIIERALSQATSQLELVNGDALPEIQTTTGPGNLSKSIFEHCAMLRGGGVSSLFVLRDWESFAVSQWPLSHR